MELQIVKDIIGFGRRGKTMQGIAKQTGQTQTIVTYILNEDRKGTKDYQIAEALTKQERKIATGSRF